MELFTDFFKSLLDIKKLPIKFVVLAAMVTGIIIFSPEVYTKTLNLSKIRNNYGEWLGVIFLSSICLVLISIFLWLSKIITTKYYKFKFVKEFKVRLTQLDHQEQSVLRELLLRQQLTIDAPLDNPVIAGLIDKRIIKVVQQFKNMTIMSGLNAPITLTELSKKHLTPENIGMKENPSQKEVKSYYQNRPNWLDK